MSFCREKKKRDDSTIPLTYPMEYCEYSTQTGIQIMNGDHTFEGNAKEKGKDRIGFVGCQKRNNYGIRSDFPATTQVRSMKCLVVSCHKEE